MRVSAYIGIYIDIVMKANIPHHYPPYTRAGTDMHTSARRCFHMSHSCPHGKHLIFLMYFCEYISRHPHVQNSKKYKRCTYYTYV